MARYSTKITGGALLAAPDPSRTAYGKAVDKPFMWGGGGTGFDPGLLDTPTGLWQSRFFNWRNGFEQVPGPKMRRFWQSYRAFDNNPLPGPNQGWRDRTVIPQVFKILENRVARLVGALLGGNDWIPVRGTDARDEEYEEIVRTLMEKQFRGIGRRDHEDGNFFKRIIDAVRYGNITGHLFTKLWWRKEMRWIKTKIPVLGDDGKVESWQDVEVQETVHNGLDFAWIPNDSIAIDLSGARKWIIERQITSMQSLKADDEEHFERTGIHLYDPSALDALELGETLPALQQESYDEPRDTEGWPLTSERIVGTPGENNVELWLCWDNQERTLTKVANRSHQLAHGIAPTPDGLDPYISTPAVPIPGRVYGDSMIHYIDGLQRSQTRIRRARMDEILINLWQQWVFREGTVTSNQGLFTPGGAIEIQGSNPEKPIMNDIGILPRHPVFTEAWTEEQYAQTQAESVAGEDALSMGNEATGKSRDVTATETQQRVLQGSNRKNVEHVYWEVGFKVPMLQKAFDLLKQNLTTPQSMRVLGKDVTIDLRNLDRPVDFEFGQDLFGPSKTDQQAQSQEEVALAESPTFGPYMKPHEILVEKNKVWGRKNVERFVRTEEEVEQKRQADMAAAAAAAGGVGSPAGPPDSPQAAGVGQAAEAAGGEGGLTGPGGASPAAAPAASQPSVEYV